MNKSKNCAIVKITWPDGSVSYMKQGGITVTDKENATIYSQQVAYMIATQTHSYLGEHYEIEEAR